MSHRSERVASTIKRAVHEALARGVADPRIRGMVTVTEVEVSPDLHQARVFVSVMPEPQGQSTLNGLRSAAPRIQRIVNDRIHMRRTPRIEFVLDERLKKQADVLAAINRALGRDEGSEPEPDVESVDDLHREFAAFDEEDHAAAERGREASGGDGDVESGSSEGHDKD